MKEAATQESARTVPPPYRLTGPHEERNGRQVWRLYTGGPHREMQLVLQQASVTLRFYRKPVLTGDRITSGGYYELTDGQLRRASEVLWEAAPPEARTGLFVAKACLPASEPQVSPGPSVKAELRAKLTEARTELERGWESRTWHLLGEALTLLEEEAGPRAVKREETADGET